MKPRAASLFRMCIILPFMWLLISDIPHSDFGCQARGQGGGSEFSHASDEPSDCQTNSCELPPRRRLKEIAIGGTHMIRGCNAGPSPQDHLI